MVSGFQTDRRKQVLSEDAGARSVLGGSGGFHTQGAGAGALCSWRPGLRRFAGTHGVPHGVPWDGAGPVLGVSRIWSYLVGDTRSPWSQSLPLQLQTQVCGSGETPGFAEV